MPRVIAITSGKGGVGKSNFVLNVGIALAMMDYSVQILDADLGLANQDVLLGIRPLRGLEDVVAGKSGIRDIIINTDYKVELIPGNSGLQEIADLNQENITRLVREVISASKDKDFLLVDTGSGISSSVISFLMAVPEVIVGVTSEPTSLTDAYALIKVLVKNGYTGDISMFSSMVKDGAQGRNIHKKISSAAIRFLSTDIAYTGYVSSNDKLPQAVTDQVPVIVRFPSSETARCYKMVASTILGQEIEGKEINYDKFISRLLKMISVSPRPKNIRAVPTEHSSMEKTLLDILDEQRRTRLLLERIVSRLENDQPEQPLFKGKTIA